MMLPRHMMEDFALEWETVTYPSEARDHITAIGYKHIASIVFTAQKLAQWAASGEWDKLKEWRKND